MPEKKKTLNLSNDLLESIEMAMNDRQEEQTWYLDLEQEETVIVWDSFMGEEEMEEVGELIEQDVNEERFIEISPTPPREGWEQMESFILGLDDQNEETREL